MSTHTQEGKRVNDSIPSLTQSSSRVLSAVKNQRSPSGDRWTTDWSRWRWPTTGMRTCRGPVTVTTPPWQGDRHGNQFSVTPFIWNHPPGDVSRDKIKATIQRTINGTPFLICDQDIFSIFFTFWYFCFTRAFRKSSHGSPPFFLFHFSDRLSEQQLLEKVTATKCKDFARKHKSFILIFILIFFGLPKITHSWEWTLTRVHKGTLRLRSGFYLSLLVSVLLAYFCTILVQHDIYWLGVAFATGNCLSIQDGWHSCALNFPFSFFIFFLR